VKFLSVTSWIPDGTMGIPWRRVVEALSLTEKTTLLIEFKGLYFIVKKNVVDNALVVLEEVTGTAKAKNPLPEPYLYLADAVFVPHPFGDLLAEEMHD